MKTSELRQIIKEEISKVMNKEIKTTLNEKISFSTIDRMEGLANVKHLNTMTSNLITLTNEWLKEGFEKEDIIDYLTWYVNTI